MLVEEVVDWLEGAVSLVVGTLLTSCSISQIHLILSSEFVFTSYICVTIVLLFLETKSFKVFS